MPYRHEWATLEGRFRGASDPDVARLAREIDKRGRRLMASITEAGEFDEDREARRMLPLVWGYQGVVADLAQTNMAVAPGAFTFWRPALKTRVKRLVVHSNDLVLTGTLQVAFRRNGLGETGAEASLDSAHPTTAVLELAEFPGLARLEIEDLVTLVISADGSWTQNDAVAFPSFDVQAFLEVVS